MSSARLRLLKGERDFFIARAEVRDAATVSPPPTIQGGEESRDTDTRIISHCLSLMRNVVPHQPFSEDLDCVDPISTIVPFANENGYHEVDRFSCEGMSRLIVPLNHDAVQDMIVVMNPVNAIGCEKMRPGTHGCVYLPYISSDLSKRHFSLFVQSEERKTYYMGRYVVAKIPVRSLSLDGWRSLPRDQQIAMAYQTAGWERLDQVDIPRVLEEYDRGHRRLNIVPLFCGYFDIAVYHSSWTLDAVKIGKLRLRHEAKNFPAKI